MLLGQYMLLFSLILIIPLAVSSVIFFVQIRQIEESVTRDNLEKLKLNQLILEDMIIQIDRMVDQIGTNPAVRTILNLPPELSSVQSMFVYDTYRFIENIMVELPFIMDTLVYFEQPSILFSRKDLFFTPSRFYGYYYSEYDTEADQWLARISRDSLVRKQVLRKDVTYEGKTGSVLLYTSSLPFYSRSRSLGQIIVLLDEERIHKELSRYLTGPEGEVIVLKGDGSLFSRYTGERMEPLDLTDHGLGEGISRFKEGKVNYLISGIRSDYNDWLYVSVTPEKQFFSQLRRTQILFYMLLGIILCLGFPLVFLTVYRSTRPLISVTDFLGTNGIDVEEAYRHPFSLLPKGITEVSSRYKALEETLLEQKTLIRHVVIERLFRGDFEAEEELNATLQHYDIDISGIHYAVFAVLIDGYFDAVNEDILKEFTLKNTLIRNQLKSILPEKTLIHEINLNRIGVVLVFDLSDKDGCRRQAEEIIASVEEQLNGQEEIRCLVSPAYMAGSTMQIREGLDYSVARLNDGAFSGGAEERTLGNRCFYYYPPELELKIMTLVQSGRVDELRDVINEMLRENREERELNRPMFKAWAGELEGTLLKLSDRLGITPSCRGESAPTLEREVDIVTEEIIALAGEQQGKYGHDHRIRESLLDYVGTHFMEAHMSLKNVAREFNLSEVYLSQLFQEITARKFSQYLEDLRMTSAAELLREARLNVDQIAEKTGYASAHAFRRAFKRKYGVSPSHYK